jgi:antitoxin FitA
MASIVIRNLEEQLKGRLRVRAAHHGRSMEAEVREILRGVLGRGHSERSEGVAGVRMPEIKPVHLELDKVERDEIGQPSARLSVHLERRRTLTPTLSLSTERGGKREDAIVQGQLPEFD